MVLSSDGGVTNYHKENLSSDWLMVIIKKTEHLFSIFLKYSLQHNWIQNKAGCWRSKLLRSFRCDIRRKRAKIRFDVRYLDMAQIASHLHQMYFLSHLTGRHSERAQSSVNVGRRLPSKKETHGFVNNSRFLVSMFTPNCEPMKIDAHSKDVWCWYMFVWTSVRPIIKYTAGKLFYWKDVPETS